MRKAVVIIAVLMAILHQDFWNWDNDSLVFGFMPVGLAYHAGFSVCCAILATLAVKFAWPTELVAWAEEPEEESK